MHLTLDSWRPHRDPEGWKQDPGGLCIDLSKDNLGGEAEEALGQTTLTPSKGASAEKGEPETDRAAQHWFYDLQVLKKLTRDKNTLLQPVRPTQIKLAWHGLGDASPRREVMARKMYPEGCTLDMGFGVNNTRVNPVTTGD